MQLGPVYFTVPNFRTEVRAPAQGEALPEDPSKVLRGRGRSTVQYCGHYGSRIQYMSKRFDNQYDTITPLIEDQEKQETPNSLVLHAGDQGRACVKNGGSRRIAIVRLSGHGPGPGMLSFGDDRKGGEQGFNRSSSICLQMDVRVL